ncbi:MAG: hypothetical protein CFE22_04935 [Cytophagaceae bacterium BCCC1]|nr:MAG: hypothetical protein CFE22_04935 [Cytophagaceae bacterium BCCC1]
MKKYLILFIFKLFAFQGLAQDIQKLNLKSLKEFLKSNPISIKSGFNIEGKYYMPIGIDPRQSKFQYFASGFPSITLGKAFKVPVSFSLTNQGISLLHQFYGKGIAQRFNRISLKPTFKNHTLYLGTNALNFSNYSLAGHRFDGLGYEYKPKNNGLFGSIVWGRFLRKVDPIYEYEILKNKPSLERRGEAFKIGYKKNKAVYQFSMLIAKDLKNISKDLDLTPYRNIAFDVSAEIPIANKIGGKITYGKSLIYDNSKSEFSSKSPVINSNAYSADITYKGKNADYGIEYSRVDPNFKTFGSYFFNNDLETFAFSNSLRLLDDKLTLIDKFGFQHNNLNNQSYQKNGNWVTDLGLIHNLNEQFNYHINYSNFSNYSNFNSTYQFIKSYDGYASLDTINYHQINGNIGLGFQINTRSNARVKKNLSTELMRQSNNSLKEQSYVNFGSINLNIEAAKYNLNYGLGFTYTHTQNADFDQTLYGPNVLIMKKIKKPKILISENFSWNLNRENQLQRKSLMMNYLNIQCNFSKSNQAYFKYNTIINKAYKTNIEGDNSHTLESFFILGLRLQINKSLKK